ncbi:MAG: 7-cyano-7-deazaguanine synthase, partial [Candidatus Hodarchaeota archaeon]
AKAFGFELTNINKAIKASIKAKMCSNEDLSENKAIILLSGGIDSATALYWARNEGYNLIAISFNYYLRPEREKKATVQLAAELGVRLVEVSIPYLKEGIDLRIEGFPVPSALHSPEGFIPMRNLVFYSIAAYYAEVYGYKFIIGGHISADPELFPDADIDFFQALEKLINRGKREGINNIEILLPLIELSKIEVIKLAKKLNVPLEWTWSCYTDGDKPCGKCSSCLKRKKAFNIINHIEPELPV